ncbi:conserved hypothetical protein [Pseudomonas sp. 9AZ]|uniref:hypothetical protein n=1 Tax=Pseudomonas sp. 9AZ TaxID=2653168 RepID=UPI0012F43849|nr:hypothetical protein [Pseudomonas sp. 9AZ]VXD00095.1 conserved hypothetical protein [Pseudomonas sp. 9AZ]
MDRLKLIWESRLSSHNKHKNESFLAVYVNSISIEQELITAAERNNATTLGDIFLSMESVKEFVIEDWKKSCHQNSLVTLMACACGQWECSTIKIKTSQQDNWVHWQFAVNDVYQKNYGQLPEFWFDAEDYAKALQVLDELNED